MSVMRFESSRAISVMSTKKVEEEPQAARVAENSPGGSNSWFIISMSAQASTSYHISSFNLTLREKKIKIMLSSSSPWTRFLHPMIDIVLHVEGKTFPANKQGNLLWGIVNWPDAAQSVVK